MEAKARAAKAGSGPARHMKETGRMRNKFSFRWAVAGLCFLAMGGQLPIASRALAEDAHPQQHSGWKMSDARLIPVQSGGRTKPLDSFAREIVLFETGKRSFQGWSSLDLVFSWISNPRVWQNERFILVGRADVRRQLVLDEKRSLFSPQELFGDFALLQYAQHMDTQDATGAEALSGKSDRGQKGSPQDKELRQVLERLSLFREIVSGNAWTLVPMPDGKPWLSLATEDHAADAVRARFVDLIKAYQANEEARFNQASAALRSTIEEAIPGYQAHEASKISAEVFYNRLRPFLIAWILYCTAALAWLMTPRIAGASKDEPASGRWKIALASTLTLAALGFHVAGIAIRCYIAGRPPVTNMYESIIWVCFGVVVFAGILYLIQKQRITLLVASVIATVGLIAADAAPAMIDPGLHPLMPVLRSNYWLTIHVLTITLGYAAFALTLGLANVTLVHFLQQARAKKAGNPAGVTQLQQRISSMNLLTYRAMQFGVVLLAAGTILGGVWADYSWGRFWGWDPKEVWALIALLSYIAILHGRYTTWIGPFAFAAWTVVGFLSVLMAWYGVNFVLGVGLHSYGFASGGTGWVVGFTLLQLAFVGFVAMVNWKVLKSKKDKPLPAASAPTIAN